MALQAGAEPVIGLTWTVEGTGAVTTEAWSDGTLWTDGTGWFVTNNSRLRTALDAHFFDGVSYTQVWPEPPRPFGLLNFGAGNIERFYTIQNLPALDLPAGAWAWGAWTRVDDNTGTGFPRLLSCGPENLAGHFRLLKHQDGASANPGAWTARIDDGVVDTGAAIAGGASSGDGVVRLVIIQSTGEAIEVWLCTASGAVLADSDALDLGAFTADGAWQFGTRGDIAASYWPHRAGGLWKADRSFSELEIEAIFVDGHPITVAGADLVAYWPFADGPVEVETDVVSGIAATRLGAGW